MTDPLPIGTELFFWEHGMRESQKTAATLKTGTVISVGRKYYTVTTKHQRVYKVDHDTLCSTGEYPIRFFKDREEVLRKQWCEQHGYQIAELVRRQSFENLQRIATIIGYEGRP